jgi:hypothetical protein
MVVKRAASITGRRRGRHVDLAVDRVWFLNDPAHYAAFVDRCGWTEAAFRDWLEQGLLTALAPLSS